MDLLLDDVPLADGTPAGEVRAWLTRYGPLTHNQLIASTGFRARRVTRALRPLLASGTATTTWLTSTLPAYDIAEE